MGVFQNRGYCYFWSRLGMPTDIFSANDGTTPLHLAARNNHESVVIYMLEFIKGKMLSSFELLRALKKCGF